jgi:ribosome-binding factor A
VSERRPARVAQLLQAELARLLQRQVRDPRLAGVTVTDVRVTPDLKLARVYVRHLASDPDEQRILAGLARATPFLRARLGERLELRWVPELRFEYDHLVDEAARIEHLLREIDPDGEGRR